MLSGMKDILAKAKEARDDFKANVAPELDRRFVLHYIFILS